jgi:hypothetical protein
MHFLLGFAVALGAIFLVFRFIWVRIGTVVTSSLILFAQALRGARAQQTYLWEKGASGAGFRTVVRTSVGDCVAGTSGGWYAGPRRVLSLLALFTAAALTLALSASAQAHAYAPALSTSYPDTLAVSPTQAPPGSQVTLTGTGWDPGLLSNGGPASSGLPIIYVAPRPTSSGLGGTGACSPHCYGKQVASTSTGSPGCDPCDFTITTTVPSDAPLGLGAFQVGTAAGPVGQAADFTVTQPNVGVPAAPTPARPTPPGHVHKHVHKHVTKHVHKHVAYPGA